jgi:orotidine-5'-phosphate decarboxylase
VRVLSKSPAVEDRLIIALDVETTTAAIELVDQVKDFAKWYKIRQHLLIGDEENGRLLDYLKQNDLSILADFQSATTVPQLKELVDFGLAWGCDAISIRPDLGQMHTALNSLSEKSTSMGVLSPVLLTQMGVGDPGFESEASITDYIVDQAQKAVNQRLNGIITSCREIPEITLELRSRLIFITPGIRDKEIGLTVATDNQKRTCSIFEAFNNGADYVMIGKPILLSDRPKDLAERCVNRISEVLEARGIGQVAEI